jgi:hypothetical protein
VLAVAAPNGKKEKSVNQKPWEHKSFLAGEGGGGEMILHDIKYLLAFSSERNLMKQGVDSSKVRR